MSMRWIEEALAVWRLAHLLVEEDGPFALLARLRWWAGLRTIAARDAQGQMKVTRVATTTWAEGLTCVWCVSVWAAAFFWLIGHDARLHAIRRILATSALAIAFQEMIAWLRSRS